MRSFHRMMRVLAGGLALVLLLGSGVAEAQIPPPPDIPPPEPPAQVSVFLAALSPSVWAGCDVAGTAAVGLNYSTTLLPAPPVPLPVPLHVAINGITMYLNAARRNCLVIPFPARPIPECSADTQTAAVPVLAPRPIGLVVNQIDAVEILLSTLGASAGSIVSGNVSDAAGCPRRY